LHDILVITILATICGADNWVDINEFGEAKYDWLSTFLELPNGVPSHDTFGRVFSILDSEQFESCFCAWIKSLSIDVNSEIIAIDGKTLRGSGNRRKGKKALHFVSAWASNQGILLGQVKTDEKSNEITAIPKLLKMIDIAGSTVTIDAMGCQQSIADEILIQGADYVLALKDNQQKLHEMVNAIFDMGESRQYKKMLNRRKVEKIHDRPYRNTSLYISIST
jgi:predicted transposase YbfD/YdcC